MRTKPNLKSISTLSDKDLLRQLSELLRNSRRIESELVAHIGEVDARGLYVEKGASSMFVYCTEVLHLSEPEAYLRINVARASRKYPVLLGMLADGRLHLTGIAKLAQHLTEDNRDTLLARAARKTKRQIDELIAEISPKPDVATTVRKIPERRKKEKPTSSSRQLRPDGVALPNSAPAPAKPAVVEPTAPSRYKVQFTASAELRDKLERLKTLMRSSVPNGDLAAIIEEAVTEKLERLESKRFGKTKTPRKKVEETDTSPSSRYIPAAVKRAVCERDQNQCIFVAQNGRRCTERDRLEFQHHKPHGQGGDRSVNNVFLVCRTHNRYLAERDYGKELMARYRRTASRVREPSAVYHLDRPAARAP